MGDYIAAIWGWDEKEQRDYHARAFAPGTWQIIVADATDVGMIHFERRTAEIYLSRLEILPDHQGKGIGTRIIQELQARATERRCPMTLDVLAVNTRAHRLYQQLGFTEIHRHGKDGIKIRMSVLPSSSRRDHAAL